MSMKDESHWLYKHELINEGTGNHVWINNFLSFRMCINLICWGWLRADGQTGGGMVLWPPGGEGRPAGGVCRGARRGVGSARRAASCHRRSLTRARPQTKIIQSVFTSRSWSNNFSLLVPRRSPPLKGFCFRRGWTHSFRNCSRWVLIDWRIEVRARLRWGNILTRNLLTDGSLGW